MFNKSRKSLSFLTPQSQKVGVSQSRLSLSSNNDDSQRLFKTLLNDPVKRTLLMQVLSQEKNNDDKKKVSALQSKGHKFKCESPSALYRRRALEKMQQKEDYPDNASNNSTKKVPFEHILKGVIAYVEIKSNDKDRSTGAKTLMQAMGADIRDVLSRDVTHVVFKDGCFKTYQKAKLLKANLVSVLWVEAVRRYQYRVPEKDYPALGAASSHANVSLICQQFQKDYEDVLKDELNRSKLSKSNINLLDTEDIVDTSHNDVESLISMKSVFKPNNLTLTPNSLYLDNTPDISSDSDTEVSLTKNIFNKLNKQKAKSSISKGDNNLDLEGMSEISNNHVRKSSEKLNNTIPKSSDYEELSSLRISTESNNKFENQNITPSNKLPQYNNVTQRKRRSDIRNNVNILEHYVVQNDESLHKNNNLNENRMPVENTYEDINSSFENLCLDRNTSVKNINNKVSDNVNSKQKSPVKKSVRKLYNISDDYDDNNKKLPKTKIVESNTSSNVELTENDTKLRNRLNESTNIRTPNRHSTQIPKNKKLSNIKECSTIPRRKSTRLVRTDSNNESPQKRSKIDGADDDLDENNIASSEKSDDNNSDKEFDNNLKIVKSPKKISSLRRTSTRLAKINNFSNKTNRSPSKKVRRSSLDFISKESVKPQTKVQRGVSFIKPTQLGKASKKGSSIVCTRFHNTEVQVFQQIVKKLGAFCVEDEVTEKTTHLVAAEPRRTINLLRAMARGCWIVKSEWLYRSLEANHWLPEEDYELCEFSDAIQKARQERQAFGARFSMDIFQNCGRIYISKATNPRCSDLQELVSLCKGNVTSIVRNADIIVGECIENKSCVTVNWILDSIMFYKKKSLKNYLIHQDSSD